MTFVTHDGPFVFNTGPTDIAPNGGTLYFGLVNNAYVDCSVTVTAHSIPFVTGPQFLEVVQTATRAGPGPSERWLDIVVRNNGPRRCPYIKVWVGMVRP
jgi:hypothetical protein